MRLNPRPSDKIAFSNRNGFAIMVLRAVSWRNARIFERDLKKQLRFSFSPVHDVILFNTYNDLRKKYSNPGIFSDNRCVHPLKLTL